MNEESVKAAFAEWWQESYGRPPAPHALMTHAAFGCYLLQLVELLQEAPQQDAA
jgi:hypothetical protein